MQLPALLPLPRSCQARPGVFRLTAASRISAEPQLATPARLLAETLRRSTGLALPVVQASDAELVLAMDSRMAAEAYRLSVTESRVRLTASGAPGAFNGVQTLLQLLPPEVFAGPAEAARAGAWEAPCVEVEDGPRFSWRGFMLDCSRHFFTRQEVLRVLDHLAMHKLNVFHWHLTDDQGWRVQVPGRPLLTEVGAWRNGVGFGLDPSSSTAYDAAGRYGGFYSAEDVRAVVAAATDRNIVIVPEIEMPGHASAALTAYPSLGCTGGPYSIANKQGIYPDIYCAGKEETFAFLEEVLDQVISLFPGPFIHIGGDEAPKKRWQACPLCRQRMRAEGLRDGHELQSWFIRRIAGMVEERGRRLIGWSEIREGGLAGGAVVMDWIGGGLESAQDGHDVVMTPTASCYLDYAQLKTQSTVPVFPNSYLPVSRVRAFEPVPAGLAPGLHPHILGTQGNLWTEYVPSLERVEYQAFPRLCALADVAWAAEGAGRADFDGRLRAHLARMKVAGVRYCKEME